MARKRTDSKENAAQIMAKSAVPITVPSNVPLSETDIPFYHNVIGEFARSHWTENALEIAAMMRHTMLFRNSYERLGICPRRWRGRPVIFAPL